MMPAKIVASPGVVRPAWQDPLTAVREITTSREPWLAAGEAGVLRAAGCLRADLRMVEQAASNGRASCCHPAPRS